MVLHVLFIFLAEIYLVTHELARCHHALYLFLGQCDMVVGLYFNSICLSIRLSRHRQDAICINLKRDFCPHRAGLALGEIIYGEFSQKVVHRCYLVLSLPHIYRELGLVVHEGLVLLGNFERDLGVAFDD